MKQTFISDEVLAVLASARLDSDGLHLIGQLDPKVYQKVKKVLEALGAKWNRGKGTHVFTDANAQSKIASAIQQGSFDNEKKTFDFFETPEHVAADMAELLNLNLNPLKLVHVLEPSAGNGRLLRAVKNKYGLDVRIDAYELNPNCCKKLREDGFNVTQANFMEIDPLQPPTRIEGIIMNPPFSNGQDVEHVVHAMDFLKPGGRLVAIVSPAYTFREGKKWDAFRKLLESNKLLVEKDLPAGTFKESGTNIRTRLICLEKK